MAAMRLEPPSTLAELRRGRLVGRFEGWRPGHGLEGWACAWPLRPDAPPLRLRLILEDLLQPSLRLSIAELTADLARSDLLSAGINQPCGFHFRWGPDHPLPPFSRGLVLRILSADDDSTELAGSPLRLDAATYEQIVRPHPQEPLRGGGLSALQPPRLKGWGRGSDPLMLRLDGAVRLSVLPPDPLPEGPWSFQALLPDDLCDGGVHHLQLETAAGQVLDQRYDLLPFQLTPWAALQQHARPPFPDELSPLAREHYRSLRTWLAWAEAHGTPLPARPAPAAAPAGAAPVLAGRRPRPAAGQHEAGPDGSADAAPAPAACLSRPIPSSRS